MNIDNIIENYNAKSICKKMYKAIAPTSYHIKLMYKKGQNYDRINKANIEYFKNNLNTWKTY